MSREIRQCKTCPWRAGTKLEDIPGYSVELHKKLGQSTIADDVSLSPTDASMACHNSPVGRETYCAGWLANQLGPGNNLALRLQVAYSGMRVFFDGPQRKDFQATLNEDDSEAWNCD